VADTVKIVIEFATRLRNFDQINRHEICVHGRVFRCSLFCRALVSCIIVYFAY
jgi:hypothetical protein